MSIKESINNLFKPKAVRDAEHLEKFTKALEEERIATRAYLKGEITLKQYQYLLEATYPITKIDLRQMASKLR